MYKELEKDIAGFTRPTHGYLESWARQGVLLLNTVLTVEKGKAHSHAHLGWETFTDKIINEINQQRNGVIFLLWDLMPKRKAASLIAINIISLRLRIPLRSRPIVDF